MKKLFMLLLCLCFSGIYAQSHFTTKLEIRVENGEIIADLIALQDYELMGFQFGFYHNSDGVLYKDLSSTILPNISKVNSNEICPKYVRTLWVSSTSLPVNVKANDVILTLKYEELIPEDHFICMMPSVGSNKCNAFHREVILGINNTLPIVDDVCSYYRIENGNVLILANENPTLNDYRFIIDQKSKSIRISTDHQHYFNNTVYEIIDIKGSVLTNGKMNGAQEQTIQVDNINPGVYFIKVDGTLNLIKKFVIIE